MCTHGVTIDHHTSAAAHLETIKESAQYLTFRIPSTLVPKLGIICGSGLGNLASRLEHVQSISYSEIPNFVQNTIEGHGNRLAFGLLNGIPTVCMVGRFHFYEGYSPQQITLPIRVMSLLGVDRLIVTNAAGSMDPTMRAGSIMAIEDHISLPSLSGNNPLRGDNIEYFGPRFPPITHIYLRNSLELVKAAAELAKISTDLIHAGVYCAVGGPSYETPAELRLLRLIGGRAVGMSTVPEVIVAAHCGIQVIGISLITNDCVLYTGEQRRPSHEEVLQASHACSTEMESLIWELAPLLYK